MSYIDENKTPEERKIFEKILKKAKKRNRRNSKSTKLCIGELSEEEKEKLEKKCYISEEEIDMILSQQLSDEERRTENERDTIDYDTLFEREIDSEKEYENDDDYNEYFEKLLDLESDEGY